MLEIKTTGFGDYLDGSANISCLIIGGPGVGKTRWSSFWPKPFLVDCEDGRGSIADRGVPYVRVRSSKDMVDVLAFLRSMESVPKAERKYQTVVIDTLDSFQRIVKDEWLQLTGSGSFSGFDAWGYLDTKMQILLTRVLNLDYNVVLLAHYKTREHKDGDNTVREFVLQVQGASGDTVYNDVGLIGWMGTYWDLDGDGQRVQKRGLTFTPTPDKPMLKDRFNVTPKWMEVTFSEGDYDTLFEAFMGRDDLESMPEIAEVGQVPDADKAPPPANVMKPREGGPVTDTRPADRLNYDRMTKPELETLAKERGLTVRGNMLKADLVELLKRNADKPEPKPESKAEPKAEDPWAPPPEKSPAGTPPTSPPSSPSDEGAESATASTASAATSEASEQPVSSAEAQARIETELGGQVIAEDKAPTPAPAPAGPSACADCGTDLAPFWAEPAKKQAVRMSFVKHRRYLCTDCAAKAA